MVRPSRTRHRGAARAPGGTTTRATLLSLLPRGKARTIPRRSYRHSMATSWRHTFGQRVWPRRRQPQGSPRTPQRRRDARGATATGARSTWDTAPGLWGAPVRALVACEGGPARDDATG